MDLLTREEIVQASKKDFYSRNEPYTTKNIEYFQTELANVKVMKTYPTGDKLVGFVIYRTFNAYDFVSDIIKSENHLVSETEMKNIKSRLNNKLATFSYDGLKDGTAIEILLICSEKGTKLFKPWQEHVRSLKMYKNVSFLILEAADSVGEGAWAKLGFTKKELNVTNAKKGTEVLVNTVYVATKKGDADLHMKWYIKKF